MSWRWAPLAARCRREKRIAEMAGALSRDVPPRSGPASARPILMARPVLAPFRRAYESRKRRLRRKLRSHRRRRLTGLLPAALMPSSGWPSLAAEVFPSTTRRSMRLRGIVVERPLLLVPRSGRDVSAARPSRSELPAPHPSRLACRKAPATNVDLRLKAARNRTYERADRAGIMQAYALLDAVRGAFGAGVSRT